MDDRTSNLLGIKAMRIVMDKVSRVAMDNRRARIHHAKTADSQAKTKHPIKVASRGDLSLNQIRSNLRQDNQTPKVSRPDIPLAPSGRLMLPSKVMLSPRL